MKWSAPKTGVAIEVLSKEGFDGVEWMLGYHFKTPSELKRLARRTREGGLEISNIMCWQDYVTTNDAQRKKRVDKIRRYIESASELSIPILNTFTGPMGWSPDHEVVGSTVSEGRAWSLVADSFSDITDAAEKHDVIVTVEAVFGMVVHDYYTIREFLSYFKSKKLCINLDPSHLALYGNDPAWATRRLGSDVVKHVHVKDVAGKPGRMGEDFSFPFLGEGVVDWKAFLSALRSIGYSGFLSLEFENDVYLYNVCDGDWRVAARESKSRLLKFLRQAGRR